MRRLLNILTISVLAIVSCQRSDYESDFTGKTEEVQFSVNIPDVKVVQTKAAITAGMIDNINVLVFNENGNFLSRHKATLVENYGKYKVSLTKSDKKRIVHFICNYKWDKFSDVASLGKSENELIPSMNMGGDTTLYWTRKELNGGISETTFQGETIKLLRNKLMVSVVNHTVAAPAQKHLTNLEYAMGGAINRGTVAPFNTTSIEFTEGTVTESPVGSIKSTINEVTDFLTCGTSSSNKGMPFYTYERKRSSTDPYYIIVKGYYQDGGGTPNTTELSYYKIDIVDGSSDEIYNLERNFHYILNLNSVTHKGYDNLAEAMHNPASNNINASVEMQDFTSISEGIAQLNIETTSKLLVI